MKIEKAALSVGGVWMLLAAVGLGAGPAGAQEFQDDFLFHPPTATLYLNLGYSFPSAGSDLFDEVVTDYTLEKEDFWAPAIGGGLAFFLNDRVDLALELSFARSSTWAEYTDFVGGDDLPIEHETEFTRVPVTVSVRYFLKDRGRSIGTLSWIPTRWAPYIGAGGGRMYYKFSQAGEFIDFLDPNLPIFRDEISSSGWSWVGHLFGGVEYALTPQVVVSGEARYSLSDTDLERGSGSYSGYEPIDLSGFRGSIGFGVRF